MSDDLDLKSITIGAAISGVVGMGLAAVRGFFVRNVSMHDEQTRQRAEMLQLAKDTSEAMKEAKAAHRRLDALVTPAPRTPPND